MKFGTKEIQNIEFGNKQVQSVWYGIKKIWENYIAGLFRNGTLIKSWNNLVSEGYLSVSDNTVFSTTTTSSFMSGDLFGDKNVLNVSSYTFGGQINRWGRIIQWGCNLLKVTFPDCNYIGSSAFLLCSYLTTANFPNCSYIGISAFQTCTSLSVVNFPNCSYIDYWAFNSCTSLTTVSFPNCSYIGDYAFWCCTSLASISFPNCSYIGTAALAETSFQDNQVTASGYAEYQNSYNKYLLGVSTSFSVFTANHTFVCGNAFVNCLSLIWVSLPNCMYIHTNAFRGCSSLSSIYLMSTSVCTLKSGAFSWAGITSSTGSIIVPSSLVSAYKSAANWSYFSNRIFGA